MIALAHIAGIVTAAVVVLTWLALCLGAYLVRPDQRAGDDAEWLGVGGGADLHADPDRTAGERHHG